MCYFLLGPEAPTNPTPSEIANTSAKLTWAFNYSGYCSYTFELCIRKSDENNCALKYKADFKNRECIIYNKILLAIV